MDNFRFLYQFMRPYWRRYGLGLLLAPVSTALALSIPRLTGKAVNLLKDIAGQGQASLRPILLFGAAILAVAIGRGICLFGVRMLIIGASRGFEFDLRNRLFDHLLSLDAKFFQRSRTGDIMNRLTSDVDAARTLAGPVVMYTANASLTLTLAIPLMVSVDPLLTVLVMVPLSLLTIAVRRIGPRVHAASRRAQETLELGSFAQENFGGVRVVKSFAREDDEVAAFSGLADQHLQRTLESERIYSWISPIAGSIGEVAVILLLLVGGRMILAGTFSLGQFMEFAGYQTLLIWPMISIGWVLNQAHRGTASAVRLREILAARSEVAVPAAGGPAGRDGAPAAPAVFAPREACEVELRDLDFSYGGREVLRGIRLRAARGSTIAVIGRTGSGKSTLLGLIPRIYPVPDGKIFIDGRDVNGLPLADLRRAIGFVPQESFLFSRTIAENIAFSADGEMPVADMEAAARRFAALARLDKDIDQFPNGYAELVGERGVTLSGGQKQRAAIARALMADPRILILDDPLSAVDTHTEEEILQNLREAARGRTVILASHRIAGIRLADHIYVLEEGAIVEDGNHRDLLGRGGLYAELHRRQLLEEELERLEMAHPRSIIHNPDEDRPGRAFDRRLMGRLLRCGLPYRRSMAAVVGLILATSLLDLAGPFIVRWTIDGPLAQVVAGIPSAQPGGAAGPLAGAVGIYIAVTVVLLLLRYRQGISMATIGLRVMRDLRLEVFRHLQRLPLAYFDKNPVGRLTTRVTNDIEALNQLFSSGVVTFVADLLVLMGITAALLWVNVPLGLTTLAVLPPLLTLTYFFRRAAQKSYRETRGHLASLNGFTQESLQGMAVTQLFTRERETARRFREINGRYLDAFQRTVFAYSLYFPGVELIAAGALAAILWRGGVGLRAGELTFGDFFLFWNFLGKFMAPVRDMAERYNVLQSAMAAAERIFKVLDVPGVGGPTPPAAPPAAAPARLHGEVEFRDVWFSYGVNGTEANWAVKGVSFKVEAGETVAIVGATGAGKSTLSSLLSKFYSPQRGSIRIDGRDLADYPVEEFRRRIGVVLQDPFLFTRSIRENIRLGRSEVSDAAVLSAAARTNVERFVAKLPEGFEAVLGERGAGLSAGEKQLLTFARALAHDPDILILDEATAHVDPATEALIRAAVKEMLSGRTAIVIAHRLSTVREADRIIVLHKGEVREIGGHQELMARRGIYHRLYRLQLESGLPPAAEPGAGAEGGPVLAEKKLFGDENGDGPIPNSSPGSPRMADDIDDRAIEDLLREVGAYQLEGYRRLEKSAVSVKDDAGHGLSVVTEFDRRTEERVKEFIDRRRPGDSFLGEELGNVKRDPRRYWILDPIDGTSNFTQGIPFWGPSLALWDERGPARGWIYLPALGEMYRATRGGGAFRDGAPLRTSAVAEYSNLSTVATVSRMHRRYRLTCPAKHRILGSVVANFCYLASGAFAAMYCRASIWDLAAGWLLAREAGAVLESEPSVEAAEPAAVDPAHAPSISVHGMANARLPSLKEFIEPLDRPVEGR